MAVKTQAMFFCVALHVHEHVVSGDLPAIANRDDDSVLRLGAYR